MATQRIIDILNEDRAYELAAIIQYMGHHYSGEGMESPAVIELFKKISIDEMRHAESLAERINYLGGVPAITPTAIARGGDLRKMIQDDLNAENGAIARYKAHIGICAEEGDITSRRLLEDILAVEEGHANQWETVLGVQKQP